MLTPSDDVAAPRTTVAALAARGPSHPQQGDALGAATVDVVDDHEARSTRDQLPGDAVEIQGSGFPEEPSHTLVVGPRVPKKPGPHQAGRLVGRRQRSQDLETAADRVGGAGIKHRGLADAPRAGEHENRA